MINSLSISRNLISYWYEVSQSKHFRVSYLTKIIINALNSFDSHIDLILFQINLIVTHSTMSWYKSFFTQLRKAIRQWSSFSHHLMKISKNFSFEAIDTNWRETISSRFSMYFQRKFHLNTSNTSRFHFKKFTESQIFDMKRRIWKTEKNILWCSIVMI